MASPWSSVAPVPFAVLPAPHDRAADRDDQRLVRHREREEPDRTATRTSEHRPDQLQLGDTLDRSAQHGNGLRHRGRFRDPSEASGGSPSARRQAQPVSRDVRPWSVSSGGGAGPGAPLETRGGDVDGLLPLTRRGVGQADDVEDLGAAEAGGLHRSHDGDPATCPWRRPGRRGAAPAVSPRPAGRAGRSSRTSRARTGPAPARGRGAARRCRAGRAGGTRSPPAGP